MMTLIAGMLNLIRQGNYMVELARDHTRTTQILQSKIEDMRTYRLSDIGPEGTLEIFQPEGNFASSFASDYVCYVWNWDLVAEEKKQVYVYAFWTESMTQLPTATTMVRWQVMQLSTVQFRPAMAIFSAMWPREEDCPHSVPMVLYAARTHQMESKSTRRESPMIFTLILRILNNQLEMQPLNRLSLPAEQSEFPPTQRQQIIT